MKRKKMRNRPVYAICNALGTALLIILIVVCIPLTVPRIFGYQAYTVISGSMEPEIPTGSLVYVKNVEPEMVQKGDVIAYYGGRDTSTVITHRVVENNTTERRFITKGDANRTEDMNPVAYRYFLGKAVLNIPELGVVAQLLTVPEGKLAAGCMIGLAVILHLLAVLLGRNE